MTRMDGPPSCFFSPVGCAFPHPELFSTQTLESFQSTPVLTLADPGPVSSPAIAPSTISSVSVSSTTTQQVILTSSTIINPVPVSPSVLDVLTPFETITTTSHLNCTMVMISSTVTEVPHSSIRTTTVASTTQAQSTVTVSVLEISTSMTATRQTSRARLNYSTRNLWRILIAIMFVRFIQ